MFLWCEELKCSYHPLPYEKPEGVIEKIKSIENEVETIRKAEEEKT